MRKIISIVVFILLPASLVHAEGVKPNWRYASWGMSPAELIDASGGEVKALENPAQHPLNVLGDKSQTITHYERVRLGRFPFKAEFGFSAQSDELQFVLLELLDRSLCNNLVDNVTAKYGKPLSGMANVLTWQDRERGNLIRYFSSACSLRYDPLVSQEENDL